MKYNFDLNCDLGELEGAEGLAFEAEVISLVTSVNVACGFHAGSPTRIREIVWLAQEHGVAIGAHPGYADRAGFGRTVIPMSTSEIHSMVLCQIGVCGAIVHSEGLRLNHVKPHGALYNLAAVDMKVAKAIAQAVADWDTNCTLVGLAGSRLIQAGQELGLKTASEVFADRAYQADGTLVPRDQANAVIHDCQTIADRVLHMLVERSVIAIDGTLVVIEPQTVCIHGDNPNAIAIARRLRRLIDSELS